MDRAILIVEDETDLADLVRHNLEREGYQCRCATNGEDGLAEARRNPPDVLILDRMLPRMSGDQVIARLRREPKTAGIPILMLTAKAEESDELVGFALGADDYMTKPFSMKLLLARIDALLRRASALSSQPDVLNVGPITLDRDRREAALDGNAIALTATEFGILWELIAARGRCGRTFCDARITNRHPSWNRLIGFSPLLEAACARGASGGFRVQFCIHDSTGRNQCYYGYELTNDKRAA